MSKWIPSWSYVAVDYNCPVAELADATQFSIFRNNLNGKSFRLKLNNLYNPESVIISHASVYLRDRESGKERGPFPVRFEGQETMILPANCAPLSDPIEEEVKETEDFIIRMYFEEKTSFFSVCSSSAGRSWLSTFQRGDYLTGKAGFPLRKADVSKVMAQDPGSPIFVVCLSEILVETEDEVKLIAVFGDSVTQMSNYSDSLLYRLYEAYPGKVALINGGINGNRINRSFPVSEMFTGGGHMFGIAGKDRIVRDLCQEAVPDIVFILEGVNDCSHSIAFNETPHENAEAIYEGLVEMIRKIQEKGSKVYVSTTGPFGGKGMNWREEGEAMRCRLNDLIRQGTPADDFIDLEAMMRDPDNPHFMQDGMHLGDGVHPNIFGGEKIAKAIFQKWFAKGL